MKIVLLQKKALLGNARFMKRVLNMSEKRRNTKKKHLKKELKIRGGNQQIGPFVMSNDPHL